MVKKMILDFKEEKKPLSCTLFYNEMELINTCNIGIALPEWQ
jgi:hypothetical protein